MNWPVVIDWLMNLNWRIETNTPRIDFKLSDSPLMNNGEIIANRWPLTSHEDVDTHWRVEGRQRPIGRRLITGRVHPPIFKLSNTFLTPFFFFFLIFFIFFFFFFIILKRHLITPLHTNLFQHMQMLQSIPQSIFYANIEVITTMTIYLWLIICCLVDLLTCEMVSQKSNVKHRKSKCRLWWKKNTQTCYLFGDNNGYAMTCLSQSWKQFARNK